MPCFRKKCKYGITFLVWHMFNSVFYFFYTLHLY